MTTKQEESVDDVPTELMHRIQSLLSEKEAARTCVLSKSWLHAWSTIPTLRFGQNHRVDTDLICNTIQRYHNNNLPIEALKIRFSEDLDEIRMRCILAAETRSYLKELSLEIYTGYKFIFSDDLLFSGDKLHTIKLNFFYCWINPGINPVIKCVSLRVLELLWVSISEDVFHNLLSTCSLLEKVRLRRCRGLETIKVKNLGCLHHLEINPYYGGDILEIDNVPSLGFFYYDFQSNFSSFKITDTTASSLGRSVTRLHLKGMIIEITFFDMIESKFPFLESLKLVKIRVRASKRLVITSLSLKRLTLWLVQGHKFIDLQVNAPNLLSFDFEGETLPTLFFPAFAPKEIKLALEPRKPLDTSFFLKLREVLNLSSKFDINIESINKSPFPLNTDDVDDLRKRVLFPVTNVQQLSILMNRRFKEHSRVFDAFFSICHPIYVEVLDLKRRLSKLTVVRGMMENNTTDLKDVLIKNPLSGRWEALTSSWETELLDSLARDVEFKLNWFSHD